MMESVTAMDTSGDFLENFEEAEEGEVEDGELVDDEDDNKMFDSEEDKLSLRAKRFGLDKSDSKKYINPELERFHRSMGVGKETRTEALHLLGTDNMKTLDVFSYFSGYSPASIEWINDKACNVVWLDEESCAKALKNRSIKITGQNVENEDLDENEESISIEDIRCALPPGIWRKGQPNSLAPQLFIRYATFSDKKGMQPQNIRFFGNGTFNRNIFLDEGDEVAKKIKHDTGNPWSDIARQWRHFETRSQPAPVRDAREMLSHREKKPKIIPDPIMDPLRKEPLHLRKEEPDLKLFPIRKMHADIEERKIQERNKVRSRIHSKGRAEVDLRERLWRKRKRTDDDDEDDEKSEDEWVKEPVLKEKDDLSLRIEIDNTKNDDSEDEREPRYGSRKRKRGTGTGSCTEMNNDSDKTEDESSDSDEVSTRKGASDLRSKLRKKKASEQSSVKSVLRTKYMKHSPLGSMQSFSPLRIEIENDAYHKTSSDGEDDD